MDEHLVGQTVDATVTDVQEYGFFCEYRGNRILVLLPEISWSGGLRSAKDHVCIGDMVCVQVVRKSANDKPFFGSIRRLDKTGNPYALFANAATSTTFTGRVRSVFSDILTVEFENTAWGSLRASDAQLFRVGDLVEVKVESVDPEEGRLMLSLAK